MVLQKHGDAMPAHRLLGQRAAALGDKVAVFQSDGLLVEAGIADDGRGYLRFIRFNNADAIFGEILVP
jgi:hypothetical protein